MSELPKGWETTLLGDICTKPQYGYTTKSSDVGTVRYLRTTDITKETVNWKKVPYCLSNPDDVSKYQLHENDILVSRAGSVGFSHLYEGGTDDPVVFASYLIRFNPLKGIQPNFVKYFLGSRSYWDQISDMSAGIAVQNVNAQKLSKLGLPLPPTNEQKRIAEKLDQLLEEVNTVKTRLNQIPTILKNFRLSIYSAATRGNLIKSEAPWEKLILQDVAKIIDPQPSHRTPKEYKGGIPYIGIGDISADGSFDLDGARKVSPEVLKEHNKRYQIEEGDFVFGKIGTLGKSTPVPVGVDYTLSANVILIQPNKEVCEPVYLRLFLQAPDTMEEVASQSNSTSQAAFGIKKMRAFKFSLPDMNEQKKIAQKAISLLDLADQIEGKYNSAMESVDKITQSILAKAFRGELVPQDPNDEPASILLKRIKAEKDIAASKPKTKAKKAAKKKPAINVDVIMAKFDELDLESKYVKYKNSSILNALRHRGEMHSEEVFQICCSDENDVPAFYTELSALISEGLVQEIKEDGQKTTRLKAA